MFLTPLAGGTSASDDGVLTSDECHNGRQGRTFDLSLGMEFLACFIRVVLSLLGCSMIFDAEFYVTCLYHQQQ